LGSSECLDCFMPLSTQLIPFHINDYEEMKGCVGVHFCVVIVVAVNFSNRRASLQMYRVTELFHDSADSEHICVKRFLFFPQFLFVIFL